MISVYLAEGTFIPDGDDCDDGKCLTVSIKATDQQLLNTH